MRPHRHVKLLNEAFAGVLMMVLSTLIVQAMIAGYFTVDEGTISDVKLDGPDAAVFTHLEGEMILDSIERLSALIVGVNASLHARSPCNGNGSSFKFLRACGKAGFIMSLSIFSIAHWISGMNVCVSNLGVISSELRDRALRFGLAGVDLGLAYVVLCVGPIPWYMYFLYTLWPMYSGFMTALLTEWMVSSLFAHQTEPQAKNGPSNLPEDKES